MSPFKGTIDVHPFRVAVPDNELGDLKQLLRLSKIGPETFENTKGDASFGLSRSWVIKAREHWLNAYDWRRVEDRINSFGSFKASVLADDNVAYDIHFIALVSERTDAIPVVLLHGWPGSPLEFLEILRLLRAKYQPSELPYTIIVPSLPGYGFSSGPSGHGTDTLESMAQIVDNLMVGLGFSSGYIAQGGDLGSFVARILAARHEGCKAAHINFAAMPEPEGVTAEHIDEREKEGLSRLGNFRSQGDAYAKEHGTRPATIGLLLSTTPLALLIWIGEKFLDWTDTTPSLDQILDSVTLYWLTDTFPRAIYPYRQLYGPNAETIPFKHYVSKPLGYSWFPKEIYPIPKAWVAATGNLVWHKQHSSGGHFAAMEKPEELLTDIEEFIGQVWVK